MPSNAKNLNEHHERYLVEIGLSAQAVELYKLLLKHGSLSAQQAADYTHDYPSAHYRLFYRLEELDLIRRMNKRPEKFQAVPLETGLWASFVSRQSEFMKLLKKSGLSRRPIVTGFEHEMQLIVGRQEIDDKYADLAAKAKKEILVYAIGIAFSKKLLETQLKAVKRGVTIHHLVQQANPQNYHIIHKWRAAGVEVRHMPAERGLHFYIMDRKSIVIIFSDPDNTDNRLGILTDSPSAIGLFLSLFEQMWAQAKEVKW